MDPNATLETRLSHKGRSHLSASENLPVPGVIARDIVEDLLAALEQFESVALELGGDAE